MNKDATRHTKRRPEGLMHVSLLTGRVTPLWVTTGRPASVLLLLDAGQRCGKTRWGCAGPIHALITFLVTLPDWIWHYPWEVSETLFYLVGPGAQSLLMKCFLGAWAGHGDGLGNAVPTGSLKVASDGPFKPTFSLKGLGGNWGRLTRTQF